MFRLGFHCGRPALQAFGATAGRPITLRSIAYPTRQPVLAFSTSIPRLDQAKTVESDAKSTKDVSRSSETASLETKAAPPPPVGRFARILPPALRAEPGSGLALRKMVALAAPEKKPLITAVGLLLVSSSVTMTVPLTIGTCMRLEVRRMLNRVLGKLIDYFSSPNPV
jgi:hypothetical protein